MTKEAAMEILAEYAETAEALLQKEYGSDYTKDTIIKLADTLIELDQQSGDDAEAATIREHAFSNEIEKISGEAGFLEEGIKNVKSFARNLGGGDVGKIEKKLGGSISKSKRKGLTGELNAAKDTVKKSRMYAGVGAAGLVGAGALGAGMSGGDK